jgi:DNA processing protein
MNPTSPETAMLMALSMLKGVGPATLRKVVAIPNFLNSSIDDVVMKVPQLSKPLSAPDAWTNALEMASHQLDQAERLGARVISPFDSEYPVLLSRTRDDPLILFVKGNLGPKHLLSIAIIGTRQPTEHGRQMAQRFSQYCVSKEWSVVSGLAIGCDGIAHQATIDAGGHTVAVLAHGLQMIAPTRHQKLANDILESGGALVSQFRFGVKVMPQQYVQRDRVQAGLSQGVVMIQSDLVGGSLHASRAALEYGRWLAVPYPTEADRMRQDPKIQANITLAEADEKKKSALLKCTLSDLSRLAIIRSKEDYAILDNLMSNLELSLPTSSDTLF